MLKTLMHMYNLIQYNSNYSKTSESLWKYFRDEPAVNGNDFIVDFNEANPTKLLNSKAKITGQTENNGRKNVEITVTVKYLSNFLRNLEMPFIVKLILL